MKTKLLMLLAFVGMSLGAQATTYEFIKSDWSKQAYDLSRGYYENTDYVSKHRAYQDVYVLGDKVEETLYQNTSSFTWSWNKLWRNASSFTSAKDVKGQDSKQITDSKAEAHKYSVEAHGHGYILATEWDNKVYGSSEKGGNWGTKEGHQYLIPWVWSHGHTSAYQTVLKSDPTNEEKAQILLDESYARLLCRAFTNADCREVENNSPWERVWWAYDPDRTNIAINYVEWPEPKTTFNLYNSRTIHSEDVFFNQEIYDDNYNHVTLVGGWDVTETPARVKLYAAIDTAYNIRDSWNPVYNEAGKWVRDTLVYGVYDKSNSISIQWELVENQPTIKAMTALIDAAAKVFANTVSGKSTYTNQDYLDAANILNDGMSKLIYKHDSLKYVADSTVFELKRKTTELAIADKSEHLNTAIPGANEYLGSLLKESAYNHKFNFSHSIEMLDTVNTNKAKKIAAIVTPGAVKYYEATEKFTKFPIYKTEIGKDSTVAGFDTLAYVNAETYKAYVDKSVRLSNLADTLYKKTIDKLFATAFADDRDIKAAKKAADDYANQMERATSLYAAEINAIAMIDSVAKFVNEKCVNASEYKTLKEKIAATQNIVKTATTIEEIDLQVASLETAYNRAVVNNDYITVMKMLNAKIEIARDVKQAMKEKTPLKNNNYQAFINLSKAITTAVNDKDEVSYAPTENRTSVIEGPTYDLYDNEFIPATKMGVYRNQTPVSFVVTADSTLTHAIDLYKAQYDFETVIDSITALHHDYKDAWAYPKQILTDSLNTANVVNGQITDLTTNFGMTPIEKVAAAKKALLEADKLALTWQKTIGDSIKHAQNIDTYSYYKPQYINDNPNVGAPNNPLFKESLDYNETHEALRTKIVAESSYLKNDATTESATKEALDVLWTTIKTQWMADADTTYLGVDFSMTDLDGNAGNGVYKRALDKYNAELAEDHMTEYQKQIFDAALANAQAVRGEVVNYTITWDYPTHARIYFANWSLDYAMQMSFGVGDFNNTQTWEAFLKSEDTQLHESLAVVACYLSSGKLKETATVDEVLAEAKKVYENAYPTPEEKQEATSKLKALIRGAQDSTTGINVVNANADAISKDGKFLKNGQLIIVKNGKQYNAAGAQMK